MLNVVRQEWKLQSVAGSLHTSFKSGVVDRPQVTFPQASLEV